MPALSTDLDQIRKDLALVARQQLELDKRLGEQVKLKDVVTQEQYRSQSEIMFGLIKEALDQREQKILASHDSVHRSAIADVRSSALLATELGRSTFTDSCDALKAAVENLLAGTGAKA